MSVKKNPSNISENLSEKSITDFETEIGKRFVAIRKTYFKNISQKELGKKIFDSEPQNTMSRIEHCRGSIRTILQLFKYYNNQGVDINAIFDDFFDENNILRLDNIKKNSNLMQELSHEIDQTIKNFIIAQGHIDLVMKKNMSFLEEFKEKLISKEIVESIDLDIESNP